MQSGGDDRARCARVTDTHIAASGVPIYGHFRGERDADAGGNHSKETTELAALERDARRDAGMRAGGNAEVPEAVAVAQHNERFAAEILEGKRFSRGAWMIPGQHSEERFGAQGKQLQVFVT